MNRKSRIILVFSVFFVFGMIIVSAILILTKTVCINKLFVSSSDIMGVDVSEYQDRIDMRKLSEENVSFVYIKATEGSSYQDARFQENWKNAHDCGLPAGAYHFFSFDSSGQTQAQNYIDTVGKLNILEKEYGVKPMIYTLKNIYSVYLDGEVNDYPLWVRNVFYPAAFDGWDNYVMWQYLDTAQSDSYSGGEKYIDMDVLADGITLEKLTVR